MLLKNKKTGEIKEVEPITIGGFRSLAELNAEWEDYEEPKVGYIIDPMEEDCVSTDNSGYEEPDVERAKELGIWFETKEEAEKAVEKLKAWKRLKDNCNLQFNGIERDNSGMLKAVKVTYDRKHVDFKLAQDCIKDLLLLFGGEE